MNRMQRIRDALQQALAPTQLEITDDSAAHTGHAGAASGRGHFSIRIVSAHFRGMSAVQRHRCVYEALGSLMQTDIHALSINASVEPTTSGQTV